MEKELSENTETQNKAIKKLNLNGKEIILLGTAHVSNKSIEEVKEAIQKEMPDVVCVELDEARYNTLTNPKEWKEIDIIKLLKEGKGFLLLANLALQAFQKKLGLEMGVKPGDEMKAAIEMSKELNIKTALVDRPVQITLKRAWAKSSFTNKSKLIAIMLSSVFTNEKLSPEEIEKLKLESAMDGVMSDVSDELPNIKEVLIDERDQYLASKIWKTEGKKLIAVLGAGHLPGVERFLYQFNDNDEASNSVDKLEELPPKSKMKIALSFTLPALILTLIIIGFFKGGLSTTKSQLISYILWNGGLSAIGSVFALANPITILASFLIAPITSINPFIGVGFFTGILQAWIKKPQVKDMESLSDDICTFKGWYKNRITHALLVFLLSSIGSSIGTFITVPALILNIFK
ncbi:MAG: TraB/GumN family protein [Treponema sp.]